MTKRQQEKLKKLQDIKDLKDKVLTQKEIAEKLNLSTRMIKNYYKELNQNN